MVKLVASDVDGTILKATQEKFNPSLFDMIEKLYEKNILFVAASGRPYCELKHLFMPVADKMGFVCSDGAMTLIGNKIIDIHPFNIEVARNMLEDIYSYKQCEFLAYSINNAFAMPKTSSFASDIKKLLYGNDIIVDDVKKINDSILKIAVYNEKGVERVENYFLDKYSGELEVTYAGNQWLEFNCEGINKAVGIKALVNKLNISLDETMAFGDSYNDLDMFDCVKYSYAVESAKEVVKSRGKYICKDVETTVRKLLL